MDHWGRVRLDARHDQAELFGCLLDGRTVVAGVERHLRVRVGQARQFVGTDGVGGFRLQGGYRSLRQALNSTSMSHARLEPERRRPEALEPRHIGRLLRGVVGGLALQPPAAAFVDRALEFLAPVCELRVAVVKLLIDRLGTASAKPTPTATLAISGTRLRPASRIWVPTLVMVAVAPASARRRSA